MRATCRTCKKEVERFEVIRYVDLSGWCSSECFSEEGKKDLEIEKARERDKEIKIYGRVRDKKKGP